jgi:hypothetical protein
MRLRVELKGTAAGATLRVTDADTGSELEDVRFVQVVHTPGGETAVILDVRNPELAVDVRESGPPAPGALT